MLYIDPAILSVRLFRAQFALLCVGPTVVQSVLVCNRIRISD